MTDKEIMQTETRLKTVVLEAKRKLWIFCREHRDLTRLSKTIDVRDKDYITVDYDV